MKQDAASQCRTKRRESQVMLPATPATGCACAPNCQCDVACLCGEETWCSEDCRCA